MRPRDTMPDNTTFFSLDAGMSVLPGGSTSGSFRSSPDHQL